MKVANSKNLESCDTTYCHKTVRDLSVREVTTTDFCSDATSEPIKSVLPRKAVHKSLSSKHLSRASVSTSSVEGNVSISVSHTSASLDRSSLVFNIQEYCNLFFSGSFNIKIPLQNVLIVHIFFVFFFVMVSLLRVFATVSQVSSFNDCNSSSWCVIFHSHVNNDKDADCLQSNSNVSSNDSWLGFSNLGIILESFV